MSPRPTPITRAPIACAIASAAGAGFTPRAPGTAGSLLGVAAGLLLLSVSPWLLAAFTLVVSLAGTQAIAAAAGLPWFARDPSDHADPQWIVIDEVAGQCLTLLALPHPTWLGAALAFALFRAFDILKPGPIGWADRQGGAAGVMADDMLAGLAAAAVLTLMRFVWSKQAVLF